MSGAGDPTEPDAPPPADRAGLRPGSKIGRFTITGLLGRGGMGLVLEAHDPDLGRSVAIKIARTDEALTRGQAQQLEDEARAAARLSHPNVVTIFDAGQHEGRPYVVMQLVQGPNLAQWLHAQAPRPDEVLEVLLGAARGLAAAHAANLVHRDVKPENILVDAGRGRITDFGIARPAERLARTDLVRASEGARPPGTPGYMAPEQQSGRAMDARTDQFAFARTAERMLERAGGVPKRLRRALARAQSKDPEARFRDMAALIAALETRPTPWRSLAMVVAVAAVTALAVVVIGTRPRCPAPLGPFPADALERVGAGLESAYAKEAWARVRTGLEDYERRWAAQWQDSCRATRFEGTQTAHVMDLRAACLDRRRRIAATMLATLQASTGAEAFPTRAMNMIGRLPWLSDCEDVEALLDGTPRPEDPATARRLAELDAALTRAQGQIEVEGVQADLEPLKSVLAEAEALGYGPFEAEVRLTLGRAQHAAGDYELAEASLRHAAETASETGQDRVAAEAWIQLIRTLHKRGHANDAVALEGAAAGFVARAGKSAELSTRLKAAVGDALLGAGRYVDAKAKFEEALRSGEEGFEHRNIHNGLGVARRWLGEGPAALEAFAEARRVHLRFLPERHPFIASVLDNEGLVFLVDRDAQAALSRQEAALALRKQILPPDHPDLATSHANLASTYGMMEQLEPARRHAEQALAIRERRLGPNHPRLIAPINVLGMQHWSPGHYDEARAYHRRALELAERTLGVDHLRVGVCLDMIGGTYLEENRFEEAIPPLERALAIGDGSGEASANPILAYRHYALGLALLETSDPGRGRALVERAIELSPKDSSATDRAEMNAALALALWRTRRDPRAPSSLATALAACPGADDRCGRLRTNTERWRRRFGLRAKAR